MARAKKWSIWIIIVAAIIGGIFWYIKSREPKTTYTTADVEKGTLSQTVSVTGKINPNEQIDLTFKTTGKLKSISVDVGDMVKKGQILAIIDTGSLFSQLRQAEAQIKYQEEILDDIEDKDDEDDDAYSSEQKKAQRAQVTQAQEGANIIRDQLRDVKMISPIDGVVIRRTADPGETVVLSLNSPVITIAQKEDLLIQVNVPESDIVKIQIGQKADVTFDAFSSEEIFGATISQIDPASTVIQDVVYYRIKLKLDNIDPRLKAGMSANVDVHTRQKGDVLMVPQRAIKIEGNKKFVDVLQEIDNTTKKVFVETGLEGDEGMVEITSGLKGGEKVVTFVTTK